MSSDQPRRPDLLSALLIAAAGLVAVEAAQSVDRPVRAVTDPGVVTTRQAITPAGVQTRGGKAQAYRLDWLKHAVAGPLAGAPALRGLAFDPRRGSPPVFGNELAVEDEEDGDGRR